MLLGRGLEPDAVAALEEKIVVVRIGDEASAGGDHRAVALAQDALERAALDEIRRLLADRDRLYARADAVLDTSGKALRQSLAQLRTLVSKEEK